MSFISKQTLIDNKKTLGLASIVALAFIIALALILRWAAKPDVPDFSQYPAGSERKEVFFSYFLSLVEERNRELSQTRQQLLAWRDQADSLSAGQKRDLIGLAGRYNINSFDPENQSHWDRLLRRVDRVPPSLALAQAANESAWGTSRFSVEGHNYFGQWCFVKGCGMVPARRDAGKIHEVEKFDSPRESVEAYIRNLNRHSAYQPLRDIRQQLRANDQPITGMALAGGLSRYSERGDEYIKELRSMIRDNSLDEYDSQ